MQKFSENLNYKIINKTWSSQPYTWIHSSTNKDCESCLHAIFRILKYFLSNFEIPNPVVGWYQSTLRILAPVMTARFLSVFKQWRLLWFFQKKIHNFKTVFFLQIFKFHTPLLESHQITLRGCESCVQFWTLKSLKFSRYVVFCGFKKIWLFQKKLKEIILKFDKSWINQISNWVLPGYSQEFQIWPQTMTPQILLPTKMWRFLRLF